MIYRQLTKDLDIGVLSGLDDRTRFEFGVSELATGSLQFDLLTGSWGTGVLTIECSNNGREWNAIPSYVLSASTRAAAGITNLMDVSGIGYLRVRVTTANASSAFVRVTFAGKGDS